MDDQSLNIVLERLDDTRPPPEIEELVLAACQSGAELEQLLRGEPATPPKRPRSMKDDRPAVAYLAGVNVCGFRGIGERARLELNPGPGLTLVMGRNGTGKSSFAEAAEMALTGRNRRWDGRSAAWQGGWRNLHAPGATEIEVELAVDGLGGKTKVRRTWAPDAKLEDSQVVVQPVGRRATDLGFLGWKDALVTYRPFLPYSELGSMLDEGPSALYDAMSSVLGLDELDGARELLRQARLERSRRRKEIVRQAKELAGNLGKIDDSRAAAVIEALTVRGGPDLDAVEQVVAAASAVPDDLDVLRRLAELPRLDLDAVEESASKLRHAGEAVAAVAGTDADRAKQVADLLEGALAHHAEHGDMDCPVCGQGRLDQDWENAARDRIAELRAQASDAEQAMRRLDTADRTVREQVAAAPEVLNSADQIDVDLSAVRAAHQRWQEAVAAAQDPTARAQATQEGASAVAAERDRVRERAGDLLRQREDVWRPHAVRVEAWLEDARAAMDAARHVDDLKAAEGWFKDTVDEVRARRWEPIAAHAKEVWSTLRHRSNVIVEEVELAGSTTRRRVELKVTVDGIDGAALGVMSQGELHALALSLFLPRATSEHSPFRFLIIDDPVQSMDPAKVDGLARVLDRAARTHQVVVFTHDDRLPEAVRRLQLDATVLEVTRGSRSAVAVRAASTPSQRHLDDARALSLDSNMPQEIVVRVVSGLCRLAVEATCADVVRRRRIGQGNPHTQVEEVLSDARTLMQQLALALFDDPDRGGEVYTRLNRWGRWAGDTARACNEGAHGAYQGDISPLIDHAEQLVEKLEAL